MGLHRITRASGFRFCGRCACLRTPPYRPGWTTAKDGSWRCPYCTARENANELERDSPARIARVAT
jgi:hypothetical protein